MYLMPVFFFKQKTAYEMRISDWSSDVCSSDLTRCLGKLPGRGDVAAVLVRIGIADHHFLIPARGGDRGDLGQREPVGHHLRRSEEHTSELQSLMRISYAVFCLKKKNKISTKILVQLYITILKSNTL